MMETGKQYWRSLDQLADTPQFRQWLHREFQENASELLDSSSRRTLLKLMAASFGLAGLTACRRPAEKILPAARAVEDYIPGNPLYYSTAMTLGGVANGLVVEAHEGRPTKVEGNPRHPFSLGACSAYAQASALSLFDPDRSGAVLREGKKSSWQEFETFAGEHFAKLGTGEGLRFLSERIGSPSLAALKTRTLAKFPGAKWVEYEPLAREEALAGSRIAFGQPLEPHYHFEKAHVILSLDSDFLALDSASVLPLRQFSRRRKASEKEAMNRLYIAESQFSVTGAAADHRFRMRSSDVGDLAIDLAAELGVANAGLRIVGQQPNWLAALARDLKANRGRSVVVVGPRQPAWVHALGHLINQSLGNFGGTVTFTKPAVDASEPQLPALRNLAAETAQGRVNTLVVLGGNPVFTAPAELDFAAMLAKAGVSIHLGPERDETAAAATWHLPEAHYLEAWGDGRAADGSASIQQPLIQPLFDGRTAAEVLALLTGQADRRSYDIVRNYWTSQWPAAEAEKRWRRALHDGLIEGTKFPELKPAADAARIGLLTRSAAQGIEIGFYQSSSVYDGRFANNGWMQEAPDPMTKLVWDNAALMSAATARQLGVSGGDVIAIERAGRTVEAPVMIQPGHADQSISLALGYGRTHCGRLGQAVGFNAYRLRTTDSLGFAAGATIRKTGRTHELVTTQEHHSMEGRPLVREATVDEYHKHPHFAAEAVHHPELFSLYQEHSYDQGYQWGMVVDLNACVGCNACLVACQAENNIPIVGKHQVSRGREMHWIRMDRYYTGSEDDPQAVMQPVACHQCENAPCEQVCPVAATTHSPEGLNDMAYNRCVGTRYCANNCPYKVRRFNFLDYHDGVDETGKLVFNPDVTVRMRGVMEKCTYCVQRIQEKKIAARADGRRPLRDGEIQTACQQTCPAEAIVFGNLNDPESMVSKLKKQDRNYQMLAELNIKPRTSYLAKLRNPNPELA